jgi:hypothetical protein
MKLITAILLSILSTGTYADTANTLKKFKGYNIVDVLTIEGTIDRNGKKESAFNGCEYGKVIIFEGNKSLKCSSYGYQYAFRPDAVILYKSGIFKMIVENDIYDMSN